MGGHIGANWWIRLNHPSVAAMRSYVILDIRFVECGICPIAESVMIDSVILQCACVKLPHFYFRSEIWWSERSRWSTCIIVPNFVAMVNMLQRYGDFSKIVAAAILNFLNLKFFLKVGHVRRVELRHRAKFHGNRSNSCRDMAIFWFLKMAAAAILDIQFFKILTASNTQEGQTASPCQILSKSVTCKTDKIALNLS